MKNRNFCVKIAISGVFGNSSTPLISNFVIFGIGIEKYPKYIKITVEEGGGNSFPMIS